MDNEDLIRKAMTNDKHAFLTIFTLYKNKIYRTSYLILKDHQLAEDSVQDIFIQLHKNIHKLTSPKAFDSWLYKVTVNTCYYILKKAKKFDTLPFDESIEHSISVIDSEFEIPDNVLMRKETKSCVMECIYSLPVKHRTVLILFYLNDMSIKQIAEITESNEGTVKSRLFYGKKVLKQKLMDRKELIDLQIGGVLCEG